MQRAQTAAAPTRPRLLQAMIDAWRQPDVRKKVLFTLAMLTVFRFTAHIPLPGVRAAQLDSALDNNPVLGFLNLFSGGGLENLSIVALGVYPYITSSIVMQLLTPMIPKLQNLSKEGEQGRNRIQLYTYWIALPMALIQGYGQLLLLDNVNAIEGISFSGSAALPTLAAVISMAAGTMFLVWLGELITEKGVGNGLSLIIFGGIVAGFPAIFNSIRQSDTGFGGIAIVIIIALILVALIVFFQEAQRRIPVQYARSVFRGGRMYRQSGQSHIPLRVNSAGMIPLDLRLLHHHFPVGGRRLRGRRGRREQYPGATGASFSRRGRRVPARADLHRDRGGGPLPCQRRRVRLGRGGRYL